MKSISAISRAKPAMPYDAFSTEAALQVEKGNKAAGTRARKASLEVEKLMKEFRKESLTYQQ